MTSVTLCAASTALHSQIYLLQSKTCRSAENLDLPEKYRIALFLKNGGQDAPETNFWPQNCSPKDYKFLEPLCLDTKITSIGDRLRRLPNSLRGVVPTHEREVNDETLTLNTSSAALACFSQLLTATTRL